MNEKNAEGAGEPIRGAAWWRTSGGLAQLTGLLTLLGAVLTGAHAWTTDWLQSKHDARERASAADQQESTFQRQLEQSYFERAIASESTPETQARVLRYLRDSSNVGPEMQGWARDELVLLKALADAQEKKSAEEAKKADEQAKKATDALLALAPTAPAETRRKLEAEQDESRERAVKLASVAATRTREADRVTQQSKENKTRQCKPESVQAVQLGAEDPSQEVADAYCISSAAIKRFDVEGAEITWTTRYAGRNYRCFCKL